MLKVLYLLNYAGKAGTERYVQTLVRYLKDEKIDAYFAYNEEGLLVERMRGMGVPVFRIEMRSRFDFRAAKELAELCKRLGIDLIHCHYLRENYIAMLSKRRNPGVRVVYTSHFILANDFMTRLSNRILSPKQDRVIAVCTRGKEQLIRNGLDPKKIRVIFNAVDPTVWSSPEKSTLREEFGIGKDEFVMLCASRFAGDKGHKYLVDSLGLLKTLTDRPFRMVLAGDGPLLEETKEQVQRLGLQGNVVFAGFRQDIKNLFDGSDLYVNSSQHEALSFLILEALASGLPAVVTDMGGNNDIVNQEAGCGILVEYDNPESMAGAMKTLMEDKELLARYRKGARRIVEEKFHVRTMIEKTYEVYEAAMAGGPAEA
ncbi:glycosyltransferase [Papillibacter cinnamivorans]|uniref:Glycosyltransferase involved in cell wall bisynthesis n=1 Tax=Papillibacter cinnamivorans DSM 12816 TaxID=1122930 RepID=A0A1W2BVF4_9FIRM|nr:glycosyltransferase [Papillibacter cinnamivorans]SMC76963.1 Glycosyltransferase involved in cell wall bisynthesis [Papillibacter cinnamivorans DSM 12816]